MLFDDEATYLPWQCSHLVVIYLGSVAIKTSSHPSSMGQLSFLGVSILAVRLSFLGVSVFIFRNFIGVIVVQRRQLWKKSSWASALKRLHPSPSSSSDLWDPTKSGLYGASLWSLAFEGLLEMDWFLPCEFLRYLVAVHRLLRSSFHLITGVSGSLQIHYSCRDQTSELQSSSKIASFFHIKKFFLS